VLKTFEQSMNKYAAADCVTVKLIIQIFCHTFQQQVSHRQYFYKNSRLLRTGIIRLSGMRGYSSGDEDLTAQAVTLDRRMLDWIVGLDTEINEIVEGTNLYTPNVQLAHVILPKEQKDKIMTAVTSYTAFKAFKKRKSLERAAEEHAAADRRRAGSSTNNSAGGADACDNHRGVARGAASASANDRGGGLADEISGLVFLFSGPSGTGKTMTVNAIAEQLKKRARCSHVWI
jgi:hypothetical protein